MLKEKIMKADKTKNYGIISSLALDPIEKKPLYHFHPGSYILSVGGIGCNLSCPFCQNHEISHPSPDDALFTSVVTPKVLVDKALSFLDKGNIGMAFTYNEPLINYDFVRDTAILLKEENLKTVAVTNGHFGTTLIKEILPHIDAYNIDIKGFREEIYQAFGGHLSTVLNFISSVYQHAHVEITSLIVPGFNDSVEDMRKEAKWIASLDPNIPLHITRFFPRYLYTQREPTDISLLYQLQKTAKEYLENVYVGNV